ncbi:hypothetical protein CONLIGDRAFT_631371 [Coniochaeta ligniaria NRRL 30616]|uniref:Uncharacterized protein n=1 Tax=Coniochaeta ligniaria NRRL 30616 TaxID=1408157 RepID=A0A1J7IVV9_9PEZI|nr:hypothetical protein CONLIGDRAFT_631371 [Coniochaeta ligniaria NRRL 30616]
MHDQDKSTTILPSNKDITLGEDIDMAVALTAAALTADQLWKVAGSKKHKVSHLAKAGVGAAVTAAAIDMYQRDAEEDKDEQKNHQYYSTNRAQHPYPGHYASNRYDRQLTNGGVKPPLDIERRQYEHYGRPE